MIKILGMKSLPGKFLRDKAGATVVEFALVAPLFFALTFSILEAGYSFFLTSSPKFVRSLSISAIPMKSLLSR